MVNFLLLVGLFLWCGFWSAQAGRSMRSLNEKLDSWQDKKPWYSEVPEAVLALTIAAVGVWGWDKIAGLPALTSITLFAVFALVAYGGKQAATWAYLNWEGHTDPTTTRTSDFKPINDWISARLGYKLGDEGYSWVWAATKGLVTTLPVAGLGVILQPLWREISSHAKGRLPGESNFWMEFVGDGFSYACACVGFIFIALQF